MVCIKRCCRQWSIPCPSQPACSHQLWKRFPCVPCRLVVAKKLSSTGSIDLSTVVPKSVDRTCRQIFCCLTSKQNCEGCHASSFLPTVVPKTANDLSAAFPPEISRTWCRRSTSSFMATSGSALQFEPLAHRSIRAIREKKRHRPVTPLATCPSRSGYVSVPLQSVLAQPGRCRWRVPQIGRPDDAARLLYSPLSRPFRLLVLPAKQAA